MNFVYNRLFDYNLPRLLRIKAGIGIISKSTFDQEKHFHSLRLTRNDIPYEVQFNLNYLKIGEDNGFFIKIRVEPALLFKIRQLGFGLSYTDFIINDVIISCKQFVQNCITILGGRMIDEPHQLSDKIKSDIIEKMNRLGFKSISSILENGLTKINDGNTEDGLTDLREALNLFIIQIMEKIGQKSSKSIHKDLKKMKELEYIDEWMFKLINNILCDWIYRYLSAKPVHQRERIDYHDAIFIYNISENLFDHLLDRVIIRK